MEIFDGNTWFLTLIVPWNIGDTGKSGYYRGYVIQVIGRVDINEKQLIFINPSHRRVVHV